MKLTCIICPMGCSLEIEKNGDNEPIVTGNTCPRGKKYAIQEITAPVRTLTSVAITDKGNVVSVKSKSELPKAKILDAVKELNNIRPKEPIRIGDVVLANVLDTGVDIVATKNIP